MAPPARRMSGTIPSMETSTEALKDNTIIIVLGASGDLAKKKTLPALFGLFRQGFLPRDVKIVGTGAAFDTLNAHLEEIENQYQAKERNRLFYLALPPSVFIPVAKNLKEHCYNSKGGINRMIVEKPFGSDLDSARELLEDETFQMVKNILVLRFANVAMNAMWDKNSISNVQITFKEPFGTEGRGGYFDEFGIIRDILQNHLLQVLSIIAMERPVSFAAEDIRDEKVKVLRCIPPIEQHDVLLGQYLSANGKPGYLDDDTVPPNSVCPTFAATTLWIHNPRWEGVPFILKAGKALNEAKVEVRIQFKDVTQGIFKDIARNELVDHSNFVRNDELDVAWKIFTPILHWIDGKSGPRPKPELDPFVGKYGFKRPTDSYVWPVTNLASL
ncbi:glucose-6-phosphate 1-dehydrogenase [Flagelloscypha sp. PMI_526]|nr:glucose-6-phosphate 1-dehydrogenase [Flagelloscypha sp. PMI_526]